MLVEFSVGNFRSFKNIQTLSMVAAPISSKDKELDEQNTFQATPKLRLLKTKAIYGANGSGKSNFVDAMMAFKTFISSSNQKTLLSERFLFSTESEGRPSFFQIIIVIDGILYRYGYENNEEGILSEWLFATPNQREVCYFKREYKLFNINNKYLKGGNKIKNLLGDSSSIFKNNTLFLPLLISLNNDVALILDDYFKNFIIDASSADIMAYEKAKRKLSKEMFLNGSNDNRQRTVELLKFADIGIKTMGVGEIENGETEDKIIFWGGNKFDENTKTINPIAFPFFELASDGTKKVFDIAPLINHSLMESRPFIIDEFDSKLHPIITKKIVELYNKNEGNAQLIFVTHDTNLLDSKLLRRDQIAFIEKDKFGASHLYDLVEFKGVRNDASFEKDYLDGRYGAIPFVGNFDSVFAK